MTLYTLKMQAFIDHLFADEKPDWWPELYEEYVARRANDDTRYVLGLMKDIMFLQNQYFICKNIIDNLTAIAGIIKTNDVLVEVLAGTTLISELKSQGVTGAFNINNTESFLNDLRAAGSQIKRIRSTIRLREKDIEDYQQKNPGSEVTREYFENVAAEYSRFMGDMIDFEKVTVARWCSIADKYDAYCEVQNAQLEKSKVKAHGYGNN